jgi:hypothetical protein
VNYRVLLLVMAVVIAVSAGYLAARRDKPAREPCPALIHNVDDTFGSTYDGTIDCTNKRGAYISGDAAGEWDP